MPADLSTFLESVNPETRLRVEEDLGDGFVLLRRDEAERRQAAHDIRTSEDLLIELLRNSRDAGATKIFVATSLEEGKRRFTILDNGSGVPESMHERIFDPRVTTKLDTMKMDKWGVHGRGMALYAAKVNCQEARIVCSRPGYGTALTTLSDITHVTEKSDQSTFPQFVLEQNATVKISGPRNILRTCCEFALEHRGSVEVFVGTASEIAATMLDVAESTYTLAELSLNRDFAELPVIDHLAFARTPEQFSAVAANLGLQISPRTARRIMDGDILGVDALSERIKKSLVPGVGKSKASAKPKPTVKLSSEDISALSEAVTKQYEGLAERYYLDPKATPTVRVRNSELRIIIPLQPAED